MASKLLERSAKPPTRNRAKSAASLPRGASRAVDLGLIDRLTAAIDRDDPLPLFHQIASVLRWEIGMGRAAPGQPLPPMRLFAQALSVNYHTVRHAYRVLADEGVIEARRGFGTVVRSRPTREMSARSNRMDSPQDTYERVYVVECNLTQATSLAVQIASTYRVVAVPWLLEGWGEPPPGLIVGSAFHELGMRRQWPHRQDRMGAFQLELESEVARTLGSIAGSLAIRSVVLVERDVATGESLSAEVRRSFSNMPIAVMNASEIDPDAITTYPEDVLLIYAPRVWDSLPWRVQAHPRVVTLPFSFSREALSKFASAIGWVTRT